MHSNKRTRSIESDEFALDNYHFNKRYLTEVMSSSLNSLKVEDSVARPSAPSHHHHHLESQAVTSNLNSSSDNQNDISFTSTRSASPFHSFGDDHSTLDSMMSDDSEDNDSWRVSINNDSTNQLSSNSNAFTSPYSPGSPPLPPSKLPPLSPTHNTSTALQQSNSTLPTKCNNSLPLDAPSLPSRPCNVPSSPSRTLYSETFESRLPPSPSDHSHSLNLRRTAILRTAQLRRQASPRVSPLASPLVSPLREDANGEQTS